MPETPLGQIFVEQERIKTDIEGSVNASAEGVIETGWIVANTAYPVYQFLDFTPSDATLRVTEIFDRVSGEWRTPTGQVATARAHSTLMGVSGFRFLVSRTSSDSSVDFKARIQWTASGARADNAVSTIHTPGGDTWDYDLPAARTTMRIYSPTTWLNDQLDALGLTNARNFIIGDTTGFSINASNGTITGDRIADDIETLALRLHITCDADVDGSSPTVTEKIYFYVDIEYTADISETLTWHYVKGEGSDLVISEQTPFTGCVIESVAVGFGQAVFVIDDYNLYYNGLEPSDTVDVSVSAICYGVTQNVDLTITMTEYASDSTGIILYYTAWDLINTIPSSITLDEALESLGHELVSVQTPPGSGTVISYNSQSRTLSYNGNGEISSYYNNIRIRTIYNDTYRSVVVLRILASTRYQLTSTWNVDSQAHVEFPNTFGSQSSFYAKTPRDTFPVGSGSGYTSAPTVTIGGSGSGATARAIVKNGQVIAVDLNSTGNNYHAGAPTYLDIITFSGGGGSGATAEAYAIGQNYGGGNNGLNYIRVGNTIDLREVQSGPTEPPEWAYNVNYWPPWSADEGLNFGLPRLGSRRGRIYRRPDLPAGTYRIQIDGYLVVGSTYRRARWSITIQKS